MKARITVILMATILLAGCGNNPVRSAKADRHAVGFPKVTVPAVCTDQSQAIEYMVQHYWDRFWNLTGDSDSTMTCGVSNGDVEQAMADYIGILEASDIKTARAGMAALFSKSEAKASAGDTACFNNFTRLVEKYLYDPNSPARNEDFYLPYVKGLAASEFISANLKESYEHAVRLCSMNCIGDKVPDFSLRTVRGVDVDFLSVKADYTMLFFSNPGCHACKGIIEQVCSRPYIDPFIEQGFLAVVNVYIDEDLDAWRTYSVNYPDNWINGYDPALIIRDDVLFDLRAIPSLYLLDKDKRVLMKDAPVEKVLAYLDRIANNQ